MKSLIKFLKLIGPGIVTASAAIGVSHLIQSTRAGGQFGFELLWVVIAANILKYPFIEYGFRYTSGTGENLLQGYKKLSPKLLLIFIALNIIATIGTIAAVAYISAGILQAVLQTHFDLKILSLMIMSGCILVIALGHYKYLDNIMKIFMCLLIISTTTATILAFKQSVDPTLTPYYTESAWDMKYLPFIIALMGWMPAPLEISVWYSLWLEAKNKGETQLNFKQAKLDFDFGYFLMIVTAALFLSLGALIFHNSPIALPSTADGFSSQLISTYTQTIGSWSKHIIAISILAAIISTVLAVVDAYPRSVAEAIMIIRNKGEEKNLHTARHFRVATMIIACLLSFALIYFFVNGFKSLVDIVSIIAFLSAPLFAFMNHKLVNSKLLKTEFRPHKWLRILSYIGFFYMVAFSLIYIASRFF